MVRHYFLSIVTLCLFAGAVSAQTIRDTVSYSLGQSYGDRLKNQGAGDLDLESMMQGIRDALMGQGGLLTQQSCDSINYQYFQTQKMSMFTKVKEEGEAYLAQNALRPGVISTQSGLQYEVLVEATGARPTTTSSVTVHYEGMLINGKLFDSSIARGTPATFPLNRVIAGWTEGVQYMSPGSKFRFFIPYNLAYGERGAGADIPPFAALIFDVELIAIN